MVASLWKSLFFQSWGLVSSSVASNINYDVTFKNSGVDTPLHVSAWIPDGVPLRGMLYMPPFLGGDSRNYVTSPQYQAFATALGLGLVGMQDRDGWPGQYEGANATEVRANIQLVLDGAASGLSRPQISNAPLAFYGLSKGGWMNGVLASSVPDRTICVVADKCDTWVSSVSSQAKFVPGLFIGGSKDMTAGFGAASDAFNVWRYTNGSGEAALVDDWNVAHTWTNFNMVETFIAQSMARRYPAGQTLSSVPGNPLSLNQLSFNSGWLVESNYTNWIRSPQVAPATTFVGSGTSSWAPDETTAMVLRAQNAADQTTGIKPVTLQTTTPPATAYAYAPGQTIDLHVANSWLNLPDVTRVEIFHEDQLIGDYSSLQAAGITQQYTLSDRGVHTFWTEVTYLYNSQPTYASDYFTVSVTPEPATLLLLTVGGLAMVRGKRGA